MVKGCLSRQPFEIGVSIGHGWLCVLCNTYTIINIWFFHPALEEEGFECFCPQCIPGEDNGMGSYGGAEHISFACKQPSDIQLGKLVRYVSHYIYTGFGTFGTKQPRDLLAAFVFQCTGEC